MWNSMSEKWLSPQDLQYLLCHHLKNCYCGTIVSSRYLGLVLCVFMVLGQSATTAANPAIDEGVAVQKIDCENLKLRLLPDKQVLQVKQ